MGAREMNNKLDKLALSAEDEEHTFPIYRCSALKIRTGWTRCSRKFAKLRTRWKRHYPC